MMESLEFRNILDTMTDEMKREAYAEQHNAAEMVRYERERFERTTSKETSAAPPWRQQQQQQKQLQRQAVANDSSVVVNAAAVAENITAAAVDAAVALTNRTNQNYEDNVRL